MEIRFNTRTNIDHQNIFIGSWIVGEMLRSLLPHLPHVTTRSELSVIRFSEIKWSPEKRREFLENCGQVKHVNHLGLVLPDAHVAVCPESNHRAIG